MQQKPQQKGDTEAEDLSGFVFVDIQRKIIQKWIKKSTAALKCLQEGIHNSIEAEIPAQGDQQPQFVP